MLARVWRNRNTFTLLVDRKSTRLNSSHLVISYAVFCLKKKNIFADQLQHASRALVSRRLPARRALFYGGYPCAMVARAHPVASYPTQTMGGVSRGVGPQ